MQHQALHNLRNQYHRQSQDFSELCAEINHKTTMEDAASDAYRAAVATVSPNRPPRNDRRALRMQWLKVAEEVKHLLRREKEAKLSLAETEKKINALQMQIDKEAAASIVRNAAFWWGNGSIMNCTAAEVAPSVMQPMKHQQTLNQPLQPNIFQYQQAHFITNDNNGSYDHQKKVTASLYDNSYSTDASDLSQASLAPNQSSSDPSQSSFNPSQSSFNYNQGSLNPNQAPFISQNPPALAQQGQHAFPNLHTSQYFHHQFPIPQNHHHHQQDHYHQPQQQQQSQQPPYNNQYHQHYQQPQSYNTPATSFHTNVHHATQGTSHSARTSVFVPLPIGITFDESYRRKERDEDVGGAEHVEYAEMVVEEKEKEGNKQKEEQKQEETVENEKVEEEKEIEELGLKRQRKVKLTTGCYFRKRSKSCPALDDE